MSLRDCTARFAYAKDLEIYQYEKPYSMLSQFEGVDLRSSNLQFEPADAENVRNIRHNLNHYTLNDHGFAFVTAPTAFSAWGDRKAVEECYLPEMIALLKDIVPDADEVEVFDWRVWKISLELRKSERMTDGVAVQCRRARCLAYAPDTNMYNPLDPLPPATQVHLGEHSNSSCSVPNAHIYSDQSPAGVVKRVRLLAGDRADFLLRGRVRVINVWRPINHTVKNWPLALCDGSSVTYDDLLEVDLVRRDYIGSTMYAKYRPGYDWYYLDTQEPEEVCLFKNFDSDSSVKAKSSASFT